MIFYPFEGAYPSSAFGTATPIHSHLFGLTLVLYLSARESRPPKNYKCDFKFNSYTFNAGRATQRNYGGDFNLNIFKEDGKENTVGQRLEGYLKIAINRFRADPYQNRLTKVSEIQKMMRENESRLDSPWNDLLKCKKTPQM